MWVTNKKELKESQKKNKHLPLKEVQSAEVSQSGEVDGNGNERAPMPSNLACLGNLRVCKIDKVAPNCIAVRQQGKGQNGRDWQLLQMSATRQQGQMLE